MTTQRVFKFRAWHKGLKKMFHWGSSLISIYHNNSWTSLGGNTYFPDDTILMQCTDLLDINGKEIYEGDIVEFITTISEGVTEIIWREDICCFTSDKYGHHIIAKDTKFNIIGNRFEKPPL